MALKPKDLKVLTESEKKVCDELERDIDKQMLERYQGYGRFDYPWAHGARGRVIDEIRRRYGGSGGWDVCATQEHGKSLLVFTPYAERISYTGNPWD